MHITIASYFPAGKVFFVNLRLIDCSNESDEHCLFIVYLLQAHFNVLEWVVITPE